MLVGNRDEDSVTRAMERLLDPESGTLVDLLGETIFDYTERLFGEQASVARRHILYGQRKAEETDPAVRRALQSLCHGLETPALLLGSGPVPQSKSAAPAVDQESREAA